MLERAQSIAKVGSITWDFATNRVKLSAEALRIHGLTPGSFRGNIGALIEQRVHPDDRNALRALLAVAPGRKGPRAVEFRVCRPDGTVASVIGNADILRDELGRMVGMVGTLQDVTERRRMEKEILDVSTRERQAIAQDLHDSLGQQLTGIAFMSRAVARGIAGGAPDAARDAEKLADLAREAVQQARRIAHGLFPVEVGGEGLAAAIRELCERTEETSGLICRCVIGSPGLVHDRTAANHLYRIAQEATQNAVKHAQARSVTVHLTTGRSGKLVIRDDGKGIGQGASGGMGLSIMRHRASLIGARLAVAARPAGGTEVVCAFANEKPSG
jgi:PAS domain S-box-containing protein